MNKQRIAELRQSLADENISYSEIIDIDVAAASLGIDVDQEGILPGDKLDLIEDKLYGRQG